MTEYFKDKTWAITGALKGISRREATAQLKALGAKVTSGVTSKTNFLVSVGFDPNDSSVYLSNKEKKARQLDIPIFNEPQLLAILRGDAPEAVDALAPEVDDEVLPTRDVLEAFRDIAYTGLTDGSWQTVTQLIDSTQPSDMPLVLDYLHTNLQDVDEPFVYDTLSSMQHYGAIDFRDPRSLPAPWLYEVCRGEDHPKLALVRAAYLQHQKINGKVGQQILSCTHLKNLHTLRIDSNPTPAGFWRLMATNPRLAGLRFLVVGKNTWNPATADAMHGATFADNLTHLTLDRVTFQKNAATRFFAEGAWHNLTHLDLRRVASPADDTAAALAQATHIDALKWLQLSRVDSGDAGYSDLMAAQHLSGLSTLLIDINLTPPALVAALAGAAHLTQLVNLTFINHTPRQYSPSGLSALLKAPQFSGIRNLRISLDAEGIETLLSTTSMRGLESLSLKLSPDPADCWDRLRSAHHLDGIKTLNIRGNIPSADFAAFIRSDVMPNLERIDWYTPSSQAHLDDDAIRAFIDASHRTALTEIHASPRNDVSRTTLDTFIKTERLATTSLARSLHWLQSQRR